MEMGLNFGFHYKPLGMHVRNNVEIDRDILPIDIFSSVNPDPLQQADNNGRFCYCQS